MVFEASYDIKKPRKRSHPLGGIDYYKGKAKLHKVEAYYSVSTGDPFKYVEQVDVTKAREILSEHPELQKIIQAGAKAKIQEALESEAISPALLKSLGVSLDDFGGKPEFEEREIKSETRRKIDPEEEEKKK
ncbi:MAG: hypothetical protein ACFFC7_20535 [Candidatus Hermodarchaeota archaeon]